MLNRKPIGIVLIAVLLLSMANAALGGGIIVRQWPPPEYVSPQDVHAEYKGLELQVILRDPVHRPFADTLVADQIGANVRETFDSEFEAEAEVNGSNVGAVMLTGPVVVELFGRNVGDMNGSWDTEIVSMSLTGNIGGMTVMVRESPSLGSLGHSSITDLGGGMYDIDSFFDVFTELSVDGGQSWIPSNTGVRMIGIPEPATASLMLIGGLATLIGRRRR